MAVITKFICEGKPGRLADFTAKLARAAGPQFNSPVMPKSFRLSRSTVPGPDTGHTVTPIEYDNRAAYGARTDFEAKNPDWEKRFAAGPDAPERLVSVELLAEIDPAQAR